MKRLLVLFLLLPTLSFTQLKQRLADQHYARLEYAQCVDMFDELATKCIKSKLGGNWENVRKAAIVHFKLYEMKEAENYFSELREKNLLTETDREYLIKTLRYNGAYNGSIDLLRESHSLYPNNSFFKTHYEERDKFTSLFLDSATFSIKDPGFNSGLGDFGVSFYENSIIYSSKSKNVGFLNERYGWDGAYFLNMFQAEIINDSVVSKPQMLRDNFVSRAHDGPVSFTSDGKKMVITKNEEIKHKGKSIRRLALYFADKDNEGEWGKLYPFKYNDPNYDFGHGVFDESGTNLYFVSNKNGGFGGTDIYMSTKIGNDWSEPKNLGNRINTSTNEMFPIVLENELFFSSEGHFGIGGLDLFSVPLSGNTMPVNLGYPINTAFDDFNLILDTTKNRGYFSSNRVDFIDRIYSFKKMPINVELKGNIYELYAAKEPASQQLVYMKNMTTNVMDSIVSDEQGGFEFTIKANQDYRLYTHKNEFILLNEASVSTFGAKRDTSYYAELVLKPTTIRVNLRVIEKKTKNVIPTANVTITDYNTSWDTTLVTDNEGLVSLVVDRNVVFWAHGAKRGFIDTDITFNTGNEDGKVIDLELALPPIKKGEKFKLENIFYDLNKSTLRPESKSSLDKLADFIIKNDLKIELSAHTDSRGSTTYNQKLSQARAQSCVDYLISKGVKSNRILAKGYGESMLVNKCKDGVQCSEEEHQENRRTEVKILEVN